jgi:phosphoglycerate dehydrogenase-like enzyme
MKVVAYDPWQREDGNRDRTASVRRVSLEELIESADILTLHCALNDGSRGMVNREFLSRVKPGAILINASRGALIESDDVLLEALTQGWLSAIGLDVFGDEPPAVGSALVGDPRVVSTPHAVGLTRGWNERVFSSLASDVRSVLDGGRPECIANPEVLSPTSVVGRP